MATSTAKVTVIPLPSVQFVRNTVTPLVVQYVHNNPTWQWVVETGMAKSFEIPQTSTVTAAMYSTQKPLNRY